MSGSARRSVPVALRLDAVYDRWLATALDLRSVAVDRQSMK